MEFPRKPPQAQSTSPLMMATSITSSPTPPTVLSPTAIPANVQFPGLYMMPNPTLTSGPLGGRSPAIPGVPPVPPAVSSGVFIEPGYRITSKTEQYVLGSLSLKNKRQLNCQPMTKLPASSYNYHTGAMVAATSKFICYVVKDTMLRVIDLDTAERGLIKHNNPITDFQFFRQPFSSGVDRLGYVDAVGTVVIVNCKIESTQKKIETPILFRILSSQQQRRRFDRFQWHPLNPQIFALADSDYTVAVCNLTDYMIEYKTTPTDLQYEEVKWANKFSIGSQINDIRFSSDGAKIAVASADGKLRIFTMMKDTTEVLDVMEPHGGLSVSSVYFCNPSGSSFSQDSLLVTGGNKNLEIKLWNLNTKEILQTVTFVPKKSDEHGNHIAFDDNYMFMSVANTNEDSFLILHLRITTLEDDTIDFSKTRFDYLSEFVLVADSISPSELPIRSIVVVNRPGSDGKEDIKMFSYQGQVIQMFNITPEHCYCPYEDEDDKDYEHHKDDQTKHSPPAEADPLDDTLPTEPKHQVDSKFDDKKEESDQEMTSEDKSPKPLDDKGSSLPEQLPALFSQLTHSPVRSSTPTPTSPMKGLPQPPSNPPLNLPTMPAPGLPSGALIPTAYNFPPSTTPSTATSQKSTPSVPPQGQPVAPQFQPQPSPPPTANASTIVSAISTLLQQHHLQLMNRLEQDRRDRLARQRQWTNDTLSQYTTNYLPQKVESIVNTQFNNVFVPTMKDNLGKVVDEKVRKNFGQLVVPRIDIIKDTLEKNTTSSIKSLMAETFKEHFLTVLAPAFEKSCQNMFNQLHFAFAKELDEFVKKEEGLRSTLSCGGTGGDDGMLKELGQAVQGLNEISDKMNRTLVDTQNKMAELQNRFQKAGIQEEKKTNNSIKTVSDEVSIKKQISTYLSQNNYEDAFTLALRQNNLELVSWLITYVPPELIFSPNPNKHQQPQDQQAAMLPLSQGVLISLVQQIGFNLKSNVQKKLDWLQHCIVELDPNDSDISPYISSVLVELQNNLTSINDPEQAHTIRILKHSITKILARLGIRK